VRLRMPGRPSWGMLAAMSGSSTVELYWIPLGAGGHVVRFCGRVFEALTAARERRRRCALYHAALIVELDGVRHAIELAPTPDGDGAGRGVVASGSRLHRPGAPRE